LGYCYGIRSERRLTQEVELNLAYRWFCRLDLEDEVPHHSTFWLNRLGRFRESDVLRHVFERVVWAAMTMGLVRGEGFAVDASVLEANASRYHGKAPGELLPAFALELQGCLLEPMPSSFWCCGLGGSPLRKPHQTPELR